MKDGKSLPKERLMAYLDGEMSREDALRFRRTLEAHPEWRAEVEEMAGLVAATSSLRLLIDPQIWDHYWEEIDSRLQRRMGWLAASFGSLLLITWGFWKVLIFAENDLVRIGILLVAAGLIILFVAVLRGRFMEFPRDRYHRIRR